MKISEVKTASEEIHEAINRLLTQLTSTSTAITKTELDEIIQSQSTTLFVAIDEASSPTITGMLALLMFRIPSGKIARIEDVVVDEKARRRGIGEALTLAAIARAERAGAKAVDLTSNPLRIVANHLYTRLGFIKRDTNVYRYPLERE